MRIRPFGTIKHLLLYRPMVTASCGSLSGMQKLRLTPVLLNQNLHLNSSPWWFITTSNFEKFSFNMTLKKKIRDSFFTLSFPQLGHVCFWKYLHVKFSWPSHALVRGLQWHHPLPLPLTFPGRDWSLSPCLPGNSSISWRRDKKRYFIYWFLH